MYSKVIAYIVYFFVPNYYVVPHFILHKFDFVDFIILWSFEVFTMAINFVKQDLRDVNRFLDYLFDNLFKSADLFKVTNHDSNL